MNLLAKPTKPFGTEQLERALSYVYIRFGQGRYQLTDVTIPHAWGLDSESWFKDDRGDLWYSRQRDLVRVSPSLDKIGLVKAGDLVLAAIHYSQGSYYAC
jgi:hypothetical protein